MNKDLNKKHLEFIQGVITRMGQNSFQAKTWCITVLSAMFVLFFSQSEIGGVAFLIGLFVSIMFFLLDTYYLYLERAYRKLYRSIAHIDTSVELKDFDMELPKQFKKTKLFFSSMLSPATGLFYSGIILLLFFLIICNQMMEV